MSTWQSGASGVLDLPSGRGSPGCVIEDFLPQFRVYTSMYPTFGRHLWLAAFSGLPGRLNRGSKETIDDNRTVACRVTPKIEGLSCDEYPFASTTQGAASNPLLARSFDGYNFDSLPRSTGPNGFSVCMIDKDENSSAGSSLAAFYTSCRIIVGDEFGIFLGQ